MESESTKKRTSRKVIHADLSYRIYGLCFAVHNELGRFRNEKSYADALEYRLKVANIAHQRECALSPSFEGETARRNIPDFFIADEIVLDLKAKRLVSREDYFQMKRYLVSSGKSLGLIVNFRSKYLTPKRILGNS